MLVSETRDDYRMVSADDHLVEPADLFTARLPMEYRDVAPRVIRRRVRESEFQKFGLERDATLALGDNAGTWADVWTYESAEVVNTMDFAASGVPYDEIHCVPYLFEEMRPGCFRVPERLADMDANGVEASMCFPNKFVRFCGQRFLEAEDKSLALLCVRAYNDFVVEEWSGESGGRLVPICIVPLWDEGLAIEEMVRNASRGVRAVSFSEAPVRLGLPSIFSGHWDRFIAAAADTDTTINLHIGSGSSFTQTAQDAPTGVSSLLSFVTPAMALADWLLSGHIVRHPRLRVAFAECNIGWIPYVLERADTRWSEGRGYQPEWRQFDAPPSTFFARNMWCSFFNDAAGLAHILKAGVMNSFGFDNLTFETDYPHSDSTWPRSRLVADQMMSELPPDVKKKLLRDNAMRQLGLA